MRRLAEAGATEWRFRCRPMGRGDRECAAEIVLERLATRENGGPGWLYGATAVSEYTGIPVGQVFRLAGPRRATALESRPETALPLPRGGRLPGELP
jgi:hypothetical protein